MFMCTTFGYYHLFGHGQLSFMVTQWWFYVPARFSLPCHLELFCYPVSFSGFCSAFWRSSLHLLLLFAGFECGGWFAVSLVSCFVSGCNGVWIVRLRCGGWPVAHKISSQIITRTINTYNKRNYRVASISQIPIREQEDAKTGEGTQISSTLGQAMT